MPKAGAGPSPETGPSQAPFQPTMAAIERRKRVERRTIADPPRSDNGGTRPPQIDAKAQEAD